MRQTKRAGKGLAFRWCAPLLLSLLALGGCGEGKPKIVLYTDLDRATVEALVQPFTQENNLAVDVVTREAGGDAPQSMAERIEEERRKPEADLYWSDDPIATDDLVKSGAVDKATKEDAEQTAEAVRDAQEEWASLGGRVRVVVYNPKTVTSSKLPASIGTLADPVWKGRCALADPRVSTSAKYHLVSLFSLIGDKEGASFLRRIKDNEVQLLPDENAVVEAVATGKADWGITNSDVVLAAIAAKKPVKMSFPDQQTGSTQKAVNKDRTDIATLGAPILTSPLVAIHFSRHREDAQKLYAYLISGQTALKLMQLQPYRLPTHSALNDNPQLKKSANTIDVTKIRPGLPDISAVRQAISPTMLAMADVLGGSSH